MSTEEKTVEKRGFNEGFVRFFNRWTPNSMVFAFILTIVVAILVMIFTDTPLFVNAEDGRMSLINAWTGGFWNLLTFAMQMSLIMITGSVVALSPPVKRLLIKIAQLPKSTFGAYTVLLVVSWVLGWLHWGVGMMVGINLVRQIMAASKEKGYKIHSPLFVATSYSTAVAAIGISQAGPLLGATPKYLQSLVTPETAAVIPEVTPMSASALHPLNLILCVVLFIAVFLIGWVMRPRSDAKIEEISDDLYNEIVALNNASKIKKAKAATPAAWIDNSPILSIIVGGFGLVWVVMLLINQGFVGISINNFNFMLIVLGVLLCGDPETFCKTVMASVNSVWGVIIQFPFYAGIFGLIAYTGFSDVLVNFFTSFATTKSFPLIAYIYSAILNMAVPSGGSKFAIEAPYLLEICNRLNVDIGKVLVSYTAGDLTTNIIQPFWALPYLGLYKLGFKSIMPYTFMICIATLAICSFFFGVLF